MGRSPCCAKEGLNRGAWTAIEDKILISYIKTHGEGKWRSLPKRAGLKRCGKSCRLRWLNYLRPDIKRGNISVDEEDLIIRLHKLLGNRWSLIAGRLPGRTDNEIKNYWNTKLGKKVLAQSSQSSKQRPTTKSNGYKATMEPPSIEVPPLPPGVEPNIIRTKAFKCSKGFVPPQLPIHPSLDTNQAIDLVTNKCVAPPDKDSFEKLMVDVGEAYVAYPPFTDFMQACSDGILVAGDAITGVDCNIGLSPPSDHALLFNEGMLEDWTGDDGLQPYDFRQLASFLNLQQEWP